MRALTRVCLVMVSLCDISRPTSLSLSALHSYPYFLSQMSTFVYLPIFFGIVAYEFKFTNFITPEMTAFPKRKFLFMGLFDALSGICMLFGGIHTSGSFQALLLNAVIPFTMVRRGEGMNACRAARRRAERDDHPPAMRGGDDCVQSGPGKRRGERWMAGVAW